MAGVVGIFVYLIVSRFVSNGEEWDKTEVLLNIGATKYVETEAGHYQLELDDYDSATKKIVTVKVRQGYKAVNVSGRYRNTNGRLASYSFHVEEKDWNEEDYS